MYQHNRTAQPFGTESSNSALNSMNNILSSLSGLPRPTQQQEITTPKNNNNSASSHFYSKNQYEGKFNSNSCKQGKYSIQHKFER